MTQEQKVQAYDKVREKIALRFGSNVAEEIFSEFEMSENEKIKKVIIGLLKQSTYEDCVYDGVNMKDIYAWLEKQGEQKPAWSEEDENRFNNLIFLVECSKEGKATKQGFIKFINRLKSLRPKSTWKPSKEQLKFLQHYADQNNYDGTVLTSLLNDLKKL